MKKIPMQVKTIDVLEWFNGDWATPTSKQRAIETDELWELQWYPDTPVGFNFVCGATLEEVLEKANH